MRVGQWPAVAICWVSEQSSKCAVAVLAGERYPTLLQNRGEQTKWLHKPTCQDSYIDVQLGLDYWNRTKVRFKNKHLDNERLNWRLNGKWAYLKYFYTYTYTVRVNLEEQIGMIFHSAGAGNRSDTIPVEVERSEWNLYIFWPFPSGGANIFSPKIGFLSSA